MSLVQRDRALHEQLTDLARRPRMVFVAGLPGTGKSLVIHQLAHLAAEAGRPVHLLQWDVARPVFEASPAGRRHPVVDGVTQPMIRAAVGRWARGAVVAWHQRAGPEALLIGETPLVGSRLIELARRVDDDAEPLLASAACVFVIPVPSADVRAHIEAERERRAAAPRHAREREDAPPHVLRAMWGELVTTAAALGIAASAGAGAGGEAAGPAAAPPYDAALHRGVYEAVLRHRRTEALPLDIVLPTASMSVYDLDVASTQIVPTEAEADAAVRAAEARHADPAALAHEVKRWWVV
jgi:hypothetical protein